MPKGGRSGEARKMERSLRPSFLVPSLLREIDALSLEEKLAFIARRAYSSVEVIFLNDASPPFLYIKSLSYAIKYNYSAIDRVGLICFLFHCSAKIPTYHSVVRPVTLDPIRPTARFRLCRLKCRVMI